MVDLGCKHPHNLHKGWKIVLNTILKIDYFHMIGAGADKKARAESKELQKNKSRQRKDIELYNCQQIALMIPSNLITNVFISSLNIDKRGIIDFFDSLCSLAIQRIDHKDFFDIVQKVVVCVDINFNRVYADQLLIF